MKKGLLSIIIPSRSPQYLQKTVDDLLSKASEEIEIIIIFDGIWANPMIKDDPRVKIIHHGTVHNSIGMRDSINRGVAVANGEFLMKMDEHCMVDESYDKKLKVDCKDNWLVVPRRKRLDPIKWENIEDGRCDIDYMFISFPYKIPNDKTCGLHGEIWTQKCKDLKDELISETPSLQGSCYFCKKSHWDNVIKELDAKHYGQFTGEAQEVGFKTWFSGGKVVRNKKVYFSHMHKGSFHGKGYEFSNNQYKEHGAECEKGRKFCRDYWLTTKDYQHDWAWFMEKFPDMPGWDGDWELRIKEAQKKETI